MRSKEEIEKLSPVEAYNLALKDAKKVGAVMNPIMLMAARYDNVVERDCKYFQPDPEKLDNLKVS